MKTSFFRKRQSHTVQDKDSGLRMMRTNCRGIDYSKRGGRARVSHSLSCSWRQMLGHTFYTVSHNIPPSHDSAAACYIWTGGSSDAITCFRT